LVAQLLQLQRACQTNFQQANIRQTSPSQSNSKTSLRPANDSQANDDYSSNNNNKAHVIHNTCQDNDSRLAADYEAVRRRGYQQATTSYHSTNNSNDGQQLDGCEGDNCVRNNDNRLHNVNNNNR